MFVAMLDEAQRRVLIRAAAMLAALDGAQPDAEEELLAALNVEAGLAEIPPAPVTDGELLGEATAAFEGQDTARNVLLLELAGVAAIDGNTHPAEVDLLVRLAAALGANATLVGRALEFGERARALAEDGRAFIVSDDV